MKGQAVSSMSGQAVSSMNGQSVSSMNGQAVSSLNASSKLKVQNKVLIFSIHFQDSFLFLFIICNYNVYVLDN